MRTFPVSVPQPILEFLSSQNPDIFWEEEFAEGRIRVGKYFVGPHYLLSPGDRVIHDPQGEIPEPEVNFNYQMIYEDRILAVIDKPAPLPIHPTGTYFHHTLLRLLHREGKDWYTIHRLDSETSGVILLSKKQNHAEKLRQSFLIGKKNYWVLVYGLTSTRFTTDIPLGKKEGSAVFKRQGYAPQGKESRTRFQRIGHRVGEDGKIRSLLLAHPQTGRTHQIRAHLVENGFPVVGDKIYGKDENYFTCYLKQGWDEDMEKGLEIKRHFLHCRSITLTHPLTGKRMRFQAELPPDLRGYWEGLKKRPERTTL